MSSDVRHNIGDRISEPIARLLVKTKVTPNILTVIGYGFNVVVAVLIGYNILMAAGLVLLFSGLFDMLDGALARVTGKTSKAGAILDSVLDRFSEATVLIGLVVYYLYVSASNLGVILVFVTLTGSVLVSYVRSRGESLGLECKVGFFTRPERVILIAAGLIFSSALIYILWALAVGTVATSLWRLIYLLRKANQSAGQDAAK
ncbi:MAG: CDP-alcohol phosphatidyltransferase family protein [Chloroflexi bacterium]|jgi:CDP-diacylglycerol---glycerol-3-phosphate 3-phosphatidyltransferase|nr:CDP-alcohol phosphatidyltransferase family protein [Chloroflexota bacterium]MBT7082198.1 CDP-alcohol phosphatidyltransferase family protein [Chloroflexota bacterium]MBT7289907.1 CDP-alcohol phosphatidyltransferase family protein [Chloroflexota bacterium]